MSEPDGIERGKECSGTCVGEETSSSSGLDIQSRALRFRRPGPAEGVGTLLISSVVFKSEAADEPVETASSLETSSGLTSGSDNMGVGIISTKVSGNDTRFTGWNMRFAGRFEFCVVCLLGNGLLRRMLREPKATVYGAPLAKGEVEAEDVVDTEQEEWEVCGEGLCTDRIWVKASSGCDFGETGVDGVGSKAFS